MRFRVVLLVLFVAQRVLAYAFLFHFFFLPAAFHDFSLFFDLSETVQVFQYWATYCCTGNFLT